jgi:hypothetical protein
MMVTYSPNMNCKLSTAGCKLCLVSIGDFTAACHEPDSTALTMAERYPMTAVDMPIFLFEVRKCRQLDQSNIVSKLAIYSILTKKWGGRACSQQCKIKFQTPDHISHLFGIFTQLILRIDIVDYYRHISDSSRI